MGTREDSNRHDFDDGRSRVQINADIKVTINHTGGSGHTDILKKLDDVLTALSMSQAERAAFVEQTRKLAGSSDALAKAVLDNTPKP